MNTLTGNERFLTLGIEEVCESSGEDVELYDLIRNSNIIAYFDKFETNNVFVVVLENKDLYLLDQCTCPLIQQHNSKYTFEVDGEEIEQYEFEDHIVFLDSKNNIGVVCTFNGNVLLCQDDLRVKFQRIIREYL